MATATTNNHTPWIQKSQCINGKVELFMEKQIGVLRRFAHFFLQIISCVVLKKVAHLDTYC